MWERARVPRRRAVFALSLSHCYLQIIQYLRTNKSFEHPIHVVNGGYEKQIDYVYM